MAQTVIFIGGVALGPKAACRFKRLEPDSRAILLDQSERISYGGCGIPYFISGDVSDADQLQSTSFHMLRDEKFFREAKGVEAWTRTRALDIDRSAKKVRVRKLVTGEELDLSYDQLVLATGSVPRRLIAPGADLPGIYSIASLEEPIRIKAIISAGQVRKTVIIGAGPVGLEMAEALADLWGIETTVVEMCNQILPEMVSPILAGMAQHHLEEKGIVLDLDDEVLRFEGRERVERVITRKQSLEADLVIVAVGVLPNSELARRAGLELCPSGAIRVNARMQTSDPAIFSGGDCVTVPNLVTGKPGFFPFGSLANREGRVIGTNLAGGQAVFPGSVGAFILKLFEISVGGTGLSVQKAAREGYEAISAFVVQFDRAHFFPDKDLMYLEIVAEKTTGRVLGVQGLGNRGDGMFARLSAVSGLLPRRPDVSEISNLELPYSPPFSAAMDILNALGNTAENVLAGKNRTINPEQVLEMWKAKDPDRFLFLDCRGWGNAEPFVQKYPDIWKSIPQDQLQQRLAEVPPDRQLILVCNTGVRSYEAQIVLDQAGLENCLNLQGGIAALKKLGLDI
jgi:NADPH-dependent 2,4-dienoyl-CoA reductase/sulfur reductase-like enzyme/rhodanese-related sulfurtransferase